ncbi:hypothetical protein [Pseudomonas monteilii]|uniref:hypothetical protein n=1 Tax=Pseudomonas monteilii TaxID=76759 RepID=UPI0018A89964|nr:hypothetical protein [Pseudomonas monteilii]MBF8746869.1 hypothetical protein [Pseudomonas monteilii]
MNEQGSGERIGKDFLFVEDGSLPDLRMADLLAFLSKQGRSPKCPHCEWKGGWEIAMNEEDPTDTNPKLEILTHQNLRGTFLTTAAMTCPNCGHFAQISTYKIRQILGSTGDLNG